MTKKKKTREEKDIENEKRWNAAGFTNKWMFAKIVKENTWIPRKIANTFSEKIKIGKFIYSNAEQILSPSGIGVSSFLDFYGYDDRYTSLNAEMENNPQKILGFRIRYHISTSDIGLPALKKGHPYDEIAFHLTVFICTKDPFGRNHKVYRLARMAKGTDIEVEDNTETIVIYTGGEIGELTLEQQVFLDYLNGKGPSTDLTRVIDASLHLAKNDNTWKEQFMTLDEYVEREKKLYGEDMRKEGREEGHKKGYDEAKLAYLKDFVKDVEALASEEGICSTERACKMLHRQYQDYLDAKAFIEEAEKKQ